MFVRDYPDRASTWLQAARSAPAGIPLELRPVLDNLFGAELTKELPDWIDGSPCCESLLHWAEQLPGFCNDDTAEGDADYVGLLMSMSSFAEIAASNAALQEIPDNHPWRVGK